MFTAIGSIRGAVLIAMLLQATAVLGQPATGATSPGLVKMENVPLFDAFHNLARQIGINYIVDPRLCRHGWPATNPPITGQWRVLRAEDVMRRLLKDYDMKMVTNSITSVATILRATDTPNPAPELDTVTLTKTVMPLVEGDGKLDEVITELTRKAGATIQVNPDLEIQTALGPETLHDCYFYFRWADITPEQALATLLGNFALRVGKLPNGSLIVTAAHSK